MSNRHYNLSPRQKMINLMYLVLTAMLALNVSSDVLDGVSNVDSGLIKTNETLQSRNDALYNQIITAARHNPEKASQASADASQVVLIADKLISTIDSLKLAIAVEADGKNGRPDKVKNRENLEAASVVMLSPLTNSGYRLRQNIDDYRDEVVKHVSDEVVVDGICSTLSTAMIDTPDGRVEWERAKFEKQPVIAALTQLNKLRGDVLFAEGEALASLLDGIDARDLRVNQTDVFIIPRSKVVMRGSEYEADIVLAAIDSTSRPIIEINGTTLSPGSQVYRAAANHSGLMSYHGTMRVKDRDGSIRELPFDGQYNVIEPNATVSASMMNVMYAGIVNPIQVSVPGIIDSDVTVNVEGGQLTGSGNNRGVRPDNGAKSVTVVVKARHDGQTTVVGRNEFKVRTLPAPMPYIKLSSGRYNGGVPAVSRRQLMESKGVGAAIDDGILDIAFDVIGFESLSFDSMGNAIPEKSDGSQFSARQKEQIKRLKSGSRLFITGVKAKGPDGSVRQLSPIEIILN